MCDHPILRGDPVHIALVLTCRYSYFVETLKVPLLRMGSVSWYPRDFKD